MDMELIKFGAMLWFDNKLCLRKDVFLLVSECHTSQLSEVRHESLTRFQSS